MSNMVRLIQKNNFLRWINVLMLLSLTACTSTKAIQAQQQGALTMTEIYDSTAGVKQVTPVAGDDLTSIRTEVNQKSMPTVHYADYTRNADNEVNNLFKTLPNPQIPVYVFPHFAQTGTDDLPVPGYTTAFFLYPHDEYAMPSEVQ